LVLIESHFLKTIAFTLTTDYFQKNQYENIHRLIKSSHHIYLHQVFTLVTNFTL